MDKEKALRESRERLEARRAIHNKRVEEQSKRPSHAKPINIGQPHTPAQRALEKKKISGLPHPEMMKSWYADRKRRHKSEND